jgi:hypothetical protein
MGPKTVMDSEAGAISEVGADIILPSQRDLQGRNRATRHDFGKSERFSSESGTFSLMFGGENRVMFNGTLVSSREASK